MKLTITRDDIKRGLRCDASRCPIARAFKSMGVIGVQVVPSAVTIKNPDLTKTAVALLSRRAMKFVDDFDNKKPVKPLTISLRFSDYA